MFRADDEAGGHDGVLEGGWADVIEGYAGQCGDVCDGGVDDEVDQLDVAIVFDVDVVAANAKIMNTRSREIMIESYANLYEPPTTPHLLGK